MSADRILTYKRLAASLGVPLLDTSFLSPEAAADRIVALMQAGSAQHDAGFAKHDASPDGTSDPPR